MCRCGCKFCFCCGKRGSCIGGAFFNNILEDEEYEDTIGRVDEYEEEEDVAIDPLFQGDWYMEYEEHRIDPLFAGDAWNPIEVEHEDSDIEPLFQGEIWMPPEIEYEKTQVAPLFSGADWNCSDDVDQEDQNSNENRNWGQYL